MLEDIGQGLYSGEMEMPEFPSYAAQLAQPCRARRASCGEGMYAALGIEREDNNERIIQVMKNFQFFGAPVGIIITTPRLWISAFTFKP